MPSQPAIPIELLPPLLREFERLVGLRATMALVQGWGGLRVYFPTPDRVTVDHPYVKAIGLDALKSYQENMEAYPIFSYPRQSARCRQYATLELRQTIQPTKPRGKSP